MKPTRFMEILFTADLQPEDLEILTPARADEPGRARLQQAYLGPARPDAPNSAPLFSWTGAKIGYVATAELLAAPYGSTYWLVESEP